MRGAGNGSRNADHQVFTIAFFDASYLTKVRDVTVGALPDLVIFTPSGDRVLVAHEGEPEGCCAGQTGQRT